jgi:hypothetical protein
MKREEEKDEEEDDEEASHSQTYLVPVLVEDAATYSR